MLPWPDAGIHHDADGVLRQMWGCEIGRETPTERLKPGTRLEQVGNEHCNGMKDRKHRLS